MKYQFTSHAYQRVESRLTMTAAELSELLEQELTLNTGIEPNTNRAHHLFYSKNDKMCFVAIVDIRVNTVITVLPLDYHENISWIVSLDAQNKAKDLIIPKIDFSKHYGLTHYGLTESGNYETLNINIKGIVTDDYGQHVTYIKLFSYDDFPFDADMDSIIGSRIFLVELKKTIKKYRACFGYGLYISDIIVRVGKNGTPKIVSIYDLEQQLSIFGGYLEDYQLAVG